MALPAYIDEITGEITDGEAWVGLNTTTLGSNAIYITFTSTDDGQVGDFSQYLDLVIVWHGKSTKTSGTTDTFQVEINDETNNDWRTQKLDGDGSSAAANGPVLEGRWQAGIVPTSDTSGGVDANTYGCCIIHLFDINSGKYKCGISQYAGDSNGKGNVGMTAASLMKEAPITKIELMFGSQQVAGTTASLFGILPRMVS